MYNKTTARRKPTLFFDFALLLPPERQCLIFILCPKFPLPILRLVGQYPADAAAWVFTVAWVAGDDVDVRMRHCLASSGAAVEADIVGGGGMRAIEVGFDLLHHGPEAFALVGRQLKVVGDAALGRDQGMSRTDGESVDKRHRQGRGRSDVVVGDALAKRTRHT